MVTPTESARWRRSQIAETVASSHVSAPCYRLPKDVGFVAIVESETELREIQRQIFFTDVVVGAENPALQERPERFHRIRVNDAANVLAFAMIHGLMRKLLPAREVLIASVFVGRDQFNFVFIDYAIYEPMESRHIGVFDHLADNVSFARDRADDWNLVAGSANVALLVPMPIGVFPAHVGFVDFDDAHQLPELRIVHRGAQAMAHIEGSAIRARSDHPLNLKCADSLLAGQHQVENVKPHAERVFCILENSFDGQREPIGVTLTAFWIRAFPVPRFSNRVDVILFAASWTNSAVRPTSIGKVGAASIFIGEQPLKLADCHLRRELRIVLIVFALLLHEKQNSAILLIRQVPDTRLTLRERRPRAQPPVGEGSGFKLQARHVAAFLFFLLPSLCHSGAKRRIPNLEK